MDSLIEYDRRTLRAAIYDVHRRKKVKPAGRSIDTNLIINLLSVSASLVSAYLVAKANSKTNQSNVQVWEHNELRLDFETDSVRFLYETYMEEYRFITDEIRLRLELEERAITYVFVLVGTLVSVSQLFSEYFNQFVSSINAFPLIYLLLALASLLFPIIKLNHDLYMATLGSYIAEVLAPKIDWISTRMSGQSRATREYLQWETKKFPVQLQGTLRYVDYRAAVQFRAAFPIYAFITAFRYLLLATPTIVFTLAFSAATSDVAFWTGWSLLARSAAVALFLSTVILIAALLYGIGAYTGHTSLSHRIFKQ